MHDAHIWSICIITSVYCIYISAWVDYRTCAAVESQLGGGVKFLDEELGQRYSVVCVQRFVAFLPVQHQVVISVRIWRGKKYN